MRNEGDTIPAEEIRCSSSASTRATSPAARIRTAWASGLYIVKTILEQHHEHIAVTSENGLTTFAFTLSLANWLAPQP